MRVGEGSGRGHVLVRGDERTEGDERVCVGGRSWW
jgi:hypothetical protein